MRGKDKEIMRRSGGGLMECGVANSLVIIYKYIVTIQPLTINI